MEKFDLIVIGGGSGGVRMARMSAAKGASVALIESTYLGGTCVNVGCVPKKLFTYAAHIKDDMNSAKGFGWESDNLRFNWRVLRDNKDKEIKRLNGIYQSMLEKVGVKIINGHGTFIDRDQLKVGDKIYQAKHIVIATGGTPSIPNIEGHDYIKNSNDMFYLDRLPEHIVIVGGGYIAVEFAGIFHGLGVETSLIYRGDLFLRGFDEDIRQHLAKQMRESGIDLRFQTDITAIEYNKESDKAPYQVTLNDGNKINSGLVFYATGRKPLTENLGLEHTRVRLNDKGAVIVDENFATDDAHIYAIGDVIDRVALTPVALAEGMFLADYLFGKHKQKLDYDLIPSAIFSSPPIGTVGLEEAQARKTYGDDIDIYESDFKPMRETLGGGKTRFYMKMIVHRPSDKVLGIHILGPEAGEITQGLAVALKAGATKAIFDQTIGIHPTAAEELVTMREKRIKE